MNAIQNARDTLNGHGAKSPKKSTADAWQQAMNGASSASGAVGALVRSTANDVNKAKSTTSTVIGQSFRDAMIRPHAHAAKSTAPPPPTADDVKLRKTAETLVNKMFVGTMLKSMRDSPFKDPTMSGGKAGEAYAGLFDQNLAEHAGNGIGTKLVDTIVKQFKKSHGDPNQLYADPKQNPKKAVAKRATDAASAVNFAA